MQFFFRGQIQKYGQKVNMAGKKLPGKWAYGSGVLQCIGDFSIIYSSEPVVEKFKVYTDTLGQYVGRCDQHKNKVFTGDIIRFQHKDSANYGVIRFGEYTPVTNSNQNIGFYIEWLDDVCSNYRCDIGYWLNRADCKICGNVFDAPGIVSARKKQCGTCAKYNQIRYPDEAVRRCSDVIPADNPGCTDYERMV